MADSHDRKLRVLIIEDDPMLRDGLQRALSEICGHDVHAVADPAEARTLYVHVDVVLSDWTMPNGGGERVIAESPVPVLVYSSDASALAYPHRIQKPAALSAIAYALQQIVATQSP